MVTVLGASSEKVELKDLGDTVYYHQKKTYTDQQYETSRDLRREINTGRLVKLKESSASLNSVTDVLHVKTSQASNPSLSIQDIKNAMKESVSPIADMFPLMVSMLKQEITDRLSSITISGPVTGTASDNKASTFIGPEYIPDISTEGMVSNIEAKEQEVSGDSVAENLAALKKLKSK